MICQFYSWELPSSSELICCQLISASFELKWFWITNCVHQFDAPSHTIIRNLNPLKNPSLSVSCGFVSGSVKEMMGAYQQFLFCLSNLPVGQRIMTAKIGDSRYFISWQNPYAPRLNFFLAYQYCRTIAMELISLETAEEAQNIADYLSQGSDSNQPYVKIRHRLAFLQHSADSRVIITSNRS